MSITVFTISTSLTHKDVSKLCREKLKEVCRLQYGFEFEDSDIAKNEHGKPYFVNNKKLHFNISHSKEMAAIVLDDKPCGIDIELLRDIRYNVAERFFSKDELEWIDEACGEEKVLRFFKVWTGKEAYTKMLGIGLTVELNSFSVLSADIKDKLEYTRNGEYLICVCKGA